MSARLPGGTLVAALAVIACVAWALDAGPAWNWDQSHYHVFLGWQWVEGRHGEGFLPAGGPSFLNPLPYVPAYLALRAGCPEWVLAACVAAVQASAVWFVWRIAQDRSPAHPGPAWLAAALAFLTPMFLSQLGTSYIDATTGAMVLAGVWACRRGADPGPRAAVWIGIGGLAMGLATGLKLSNAIAALAAPLLFAWAAPDTPGAAPLGPRLRRAAAAFAAFGIGAALGASIAAGDWSLRLARHYGNPVFPMFDAVFNGHAAAHEAPTPTSPGRADAPPAGGGLLAALRVSGGRFTPETLGDALGFPLRIADPRLPPNLAYAEWHAPDPRGVLLMLLLAGAVVAGAARRRRNRADPAVRRTDEPVAVRPDARLVAFLVAASSLWVLTSANGRYGVALLMLASAVVAPLAWSAARRPVARRAVVGTVLAVQAAFALGLSDRADVDPGRRWTDPPAAEVSVPELLRDSPWLHVPATLQSWSFMRPRLHPDSAFASLAAACDTCPPPMRGAAAARVLDAWAGRIRALAVVDEIRDGVPGITAVTRAIIDDRLADHGLRVDAGECVTIEARADVVGGWLTEYLADGVQRRRPSTALASCRVVADAAAAAAVRARRAAQDEVFAAIERACPAELGPAAGSTRLRGPDAWAREYPRGEIQVTIDRGTVRAARFGRKARALGRASALVAPGARLDCSTLRWQASDRASLSSSLLAWTLGQ